MLTIHKTHAKVYIVQNKEIRKNTCRREYLKKKSEDK